VTTNKVIAIVVAELFGVYAQAYPRYGSEKKGLPTNYYLTLAPEPIRTHCEMEQAEFVPLNNVNALHLGNPFAGLSEGGIAFVQWTGEDMDALWAQVPLAARRSLREARARLYYLDAARIAREETPRADLEIRMQGIVLLGVFLRVAPFREHLQLDDAGLLARVEQTLCAYFGKLSEQVVQANLRCVARGYREVRELPGALIQSSAAEEARRYKGRTVEEVMHRGVITCRPDQPLADVVRTLRDQHISAIVVTDDGGQMLGILSTTDLTRATLSPLERLQLPALEPRHLMSGNVLCTWPGEPLKDAVTKMLTARVHRLVVTPAPDDTRTPIGILSMTDLAQAAERLA
jgi:CBS domain-containing protein